MKDGCSAGSVNGVEGAMTGGVGGSARRCCGAQLGRALPHLGMQAADSFPLSYPSDCIPASFSPHRT